MNLQSLWLASCGNEIVSRSVYFVGTYLCMYTCIYMYIFVWLQNINFDVEFVDNFFNQNFVPYSYPC